MNEETAPDAAPQAPRVMVELECLKCGYKWFPRKLGKKPRICPNCKSAFWEVGRQRQRTPRKKDGP